ncbi:MAG TPA: hypothetical protein VNT03_22550 [Baekduia sp.]|nr:hypothetical protein [Baekduia sp.]
MSFITSRPSVRTAVAPLALGLVALAAATAISPAGADAQTDGPSSNKHRTEQRLIVRGDATVVDGTCEAGVCPLEMVDGAMRGTPVGTGAYTGSVRLKVAEAFPNGEGGVCAPIRGSIVLGAGTADRLVLAVSGDSCQDGAGPPPAASFTTVARFAVTYGTGSYAGATGSGLAVFVEGADDHDRMTLIGRLAR